MIKDTLLVKDSFRKGRKEILSPSHPPETLKGAVTELNQFDWKAGQPGDLKYLACKEGVIYYCMWPVDKTDINAPELSEAATALLMTVDGADSARTLDYSLLPKIAALESEIEFIKAHAKCYGYASLSTAKRTYRLKDGSALELFILSEGYMEGYIFETYKTKADLLQSLQEQRQAIFESENPDTECLECGATYDTPGNVWDFGMTCKRCK